jgi:N-acetylneuraminic acid mutarotase
MSSALIGGKVYVAGGIVNFVTGVGGQTTDKAAVYDPATNTWASLPNMPRGANHSASATDGSKFWIFAGRDGVGDVQNGFGTVQVFDPATNTWKSSDTPGSGIAAVPIGRGGTGKAVFYNGEFYVIGGETKNGSGATSNNVYNRVDVHNPEANTWRLASPLPTARHGIFPLLSAGRIYVAGGGVRSGNSQSNVLEILNLI